MNKKEYALRAVYKDITSISDTSMKDRIINNIEDDFGLDIKHIEFILRGEDSNINKLYKQPITFNKSNNKIELSYFLIDSREEMEENKKIIDAVKELGIDISNNGINISNIMIKFYITIKEGKKITLKDIEKLEDKLPKLIIKGNHIFEYNKYTIEVKWLYDEYSRDAYVKTTRTYHSIEDSVSYNKWITYYNDKKISNKETWSLYDNPELNNVYQYVLNESDMIIDYTKIKDTQNILTKIKKLDKEFGLDLF